MKFGPSEPTALVSQALETRWIGIVPASNLIARGKLLSGSMLDPNNKQT